MTEAERNDSDKRRIYRKQRQNETAPETLWRDLNQLLVSYIDPFFFRRSNEREFRDQLFRIINGLYLLFRIPYGSDAAQQFSDLAYRFIANGLNVVNSMFRTEQYIVEANLNDWYQTTDEIAIFLSRLNDAWSAQVWVEYLYLYINYTLDLTRAIIERDFEQAENLYRKMESVAEQMEYYMLQGLSLRAEY